MISLFKCKPVLTLNDRTLRAEMHRLWFDISNSGSAPDAVVGIAAGGIFCAQQLTFGGPAGLLKCEMRRKSTKVKRRLLLNRLLRYLPYAVTDWLRRYEDRASERKERGAPAAIPAPSPQLLEDIARIEAAVHRYGLRTLLVIDDAVDSGATLGCVVMTLKAALPSDVRVLSAALTQTRPNPLFIPDFRLYEQVLCRFPWSFDFRGA